MDKIEKWTPQVGDTFRLKGSERPQKIEDVIYDTNETDFGKYETEYNKI